ncbi:hypothetical protein [uncultured Thermosynechococcus sp.]|uniref:hypothetical protein n=1 Tax=uncultured Thermosynechococcus sp. TaxID=436945 RepID=UPI00260E6FB0|nr:hypothetical protein [uncultured Thermosynechococcus sp.]
MRISGKHQAADGNLFQQMAALGQELIDLHLLREVAPSGVKYQGQGSNQIEFVRYQACGD